MGIRESISVLNSEFLLIPKDVHAPTEVSFLNTVLFIWSFILLHCLFFIFGSGSVAYVHASTWDTDGVLNAYSNEVPFVEP